MGALLPASHQCPLWVDAVDEQRASNNRIQVSRFLNRCCRDRLLSWINVAHSSPEKRLSTASVNLRPLRNPLARSAFGSSSAVEMAETFLWTSLANEACVVEADRQRPLSTPSARPRFRACGGARARFRASKEVSVSTPDYSIAEDHGNEPNSAPKRLLYGLERDLAGASLDKLRSEWRRLYRCEPPRVSRDLLIRGIAYRRQELHHGGLGKIDPPQAQDTGKDVPDHRPSSSGSRPQLSSRARGSCANGMAARTPSR